MKVLTILAAVALTTSSAMALDTVMGLKGRFDYTHSETENTPGGKDSEGKLTTSFLRLVTEGKINETVTAKLTLDFQPAPATDNGLSNLVDEAFLTKSFGNGLSVIVGKQAVLNGGHENEYSVRDLYTTSAHNDQIVDNITGVTAGYAMAGQNVYLQYLQQTDAAQAPAFSDKKVVGIAYYGSFMDKMIEPVISYHKQGTIRAGQYDTFSAVGLRVNVAQFTVEADYLMLEQEKLSAAGDAELNSIVALVRYNHENFKPFAKFIKEDAEKGFAGIIAGADESERTAFELGLEYFPTKDEDFRYHAVYTNSESELTKPTPSSKVEEQKIYVGIAFNYNILK